MLMVCKFKQLHFFSFCGLHRNESVVSILKVSYNTFYDILKNFKEAEVTYLGEGTAPMLAPNICL